MWVQRICQRHCPCHKWMRIYLVFNLDNFQHRQKYSTFQLISKKKKTYSVHINKLLVQFAFHCLKSCFVVLWIISLFKMMSWMAVFVHTAQPVQPALRSIFLSTKKSIRPTRSMAGAHCSHGLWPGQENLLAKQHAHGWMVNMHPQADDQTRGSWHRY